MEAELDFLRPWAAALRECLEYSTPHAHAVSSSFYCHPIALNRSCSFQDLDCCFTLSFPVNSQSQGVREALELFTVLAAVNPEAFVEFLADFVEGEDVSGLFYGRYKVVHPSWDIYLAGKVSSASSETWGQLFGCPDDPWDYSAEFRAAMDKLKTMRRHETGWGEVLASIQWTTKHEAIPMTGWQEAESKSIPTMDSFSRELGKLFMTRMPPVVQMCAVGDDAKVLEAWRQPQRDLESRELLGDTWMWKVNFSSPAVWGMTTALCRTKMEKFTLRLDDRDDDGLRLEDGDGRGLYSQQQLGMVTVNAGFLFSTMVCGGSICELGVECGASSSLVRQGKFTQLEIMCEWATDAMLAAICSAVAESAPVEQLSFIMGTEDRKSDSIQLLSPQRWGWLVYALCSTRSNASDRSLRIDITKFPLTKEYVSIARAVLRSNYPEPVPEWNSSDLAPTPEYGFVDIPEGMHLRPTGLASSIETTLVLSRTCRCRALYEPATMTDCVNVVVPGYGICKMDLKATDRARLFTRDPPLAWKSDTVRSSRIRSLDFDFSVCESGDVMKDLLALIGGGLRTLNLSYDRDDQMHLELNDVATACTGLKSLRTESLVVTLSPSGTELRIWGIKKLSIERAGEIRGLPDCLRDSSYRMSRELLELRITQFGARREYVEALTTHNKDFLFLTKEKFPARSKAATLSVVRANIRDQSKMIHRLDSHILSLIFTFAATPEQRLVRVQA